jgi:uncharacterized Zn finger protein
MSTINFTVMGSSPEPYSVTFTKTEGKLTAQCTCPAAETGQYCKHRVRILKGNSEGIVSQNVTEVSVVQSWLPGTELELVLKEVDEAEQAQEAAKKRLDLAKKKLARTLVR